MTVAGAPEASRALMAAILAELRELADLERAEPMRAYLKSTMPCLGVATPLHRARHTATC